MQTGSVDPGIQGIFILVLQLQGDTAPLLQPKFSTYCIYQLFILPTTTTITYFFCWSKETVSQQIGFVVCTSHYM